MTTKSENIDWNMLLIRIIAFIIDSVLVAIVAYIILFTVTIEEVISWGSFLAYYSVQFLVVGSLSTLYFTVSDVMYGGTLGKRALGYMCKW
jgi:uncharacterized RDD family membrane protein YckC